MGLGKPVIPVGTLAALASQCSHDAIFVAADARMSEVHFAAYRRVGAALQECQAPACAAPAAVVLPAEGEWFGFGSAFRAYGDALLPALGPAARRPRRRARSAGFKRGPPGGRALRARRGRRRGAGGAPLCARQGGPHHRRTPGQRRQGVSAPLAAPAAGVAGLHFRPMQEADLAMGGRPRRRALSVSRGPRAILPIRWPPATPAG